MNKQLLDSMDLETSGITKDCTVDMQRRFEVLHVALETRTEPAIISELLRLRPESASEEDYKGILPLQIGLEAGVDGKVIIELCKMYDQACKVPLVGAACGEYPLHLSLRQGYEPEVVEELLATTKPEDWLEDGHYYPNKGHIDSDCVLPVHLAIQFTSKMGQAGDMLIIDKLMEKKCSIAGKDHITHQTPLDVCLTHAPRNLDMYKHVFGKIQLEIPEVLLEAGPNGQLPAHLAVISKCSGAVLETMLKHGASKAQAMNKKDPLEVMDADGRWPIHVAAVVQATFNVVRILLKFSKQAGIDSCNTPDRHGRTPLQLAVTHKAGPGVIFEFQRADATSLEVVDARGRGLLELACTYDAPPWIVQELFEVMPSAALNINVLSGKWPKTKATNEALRVAWEARKKAQHKGANPTGDKPKAASGHMSPPQMSPRASLAVEEEATAALNDMENHLDDAARQVEEQASTLGMGTIGSTVTAPLTAVGSSVTAVGSTLGRWIGIGS